MAAGVVGGVDGGVSKAVVLGYGLAACGRVVEGWGKGGDEEAESALDGGPVLRGVGDGEEDVGVGEAVDPSARALLRAGDEKGSLAVGHGGSSIG